MSEFITVANIDDIPDQEGRAFQVGDVTIAVFNDGGTFRAIDDMCPHAGASLASGFFNNESVTCPWHGWRFNVCNGSFCDYPRLKVDVYDVRIVGKKIQVSTTPRANPTETAPQSDSTDDGDPMCDEDSSKANPNG